MFGAFTPVLAASPEDVRGVRAAGWPVAHLAYQVTPELRLRRADGFATPRGGLMVLSDTDATRVSGDPEALYAAAAQECARAGFVGLVADFEHPVRRALSEFVRIADTALRGRGVTLLVYEKYAQYTQSAHVIIPTAMTSGSLQTRLRDAQSVYGQRRVAAEIHRLAQDIVLPSPQGTGSPLDPDELDALLQVRKATVFYSGEMCAHYFTYKDAEGRTHFILYDDERSIARKLSLCRQLGVREAFLLLPEVREFLTQLTTNN